MNFEKIGQVLNLVEEFERRANEVLATDDGAFFGTKLPEPSAVPAWN